MSYEMKADILEIVNKSKDPVKAEKVVRWLAERCIEEAIFFAEYGWKSLVNHVAAMVNRSITGDILDIDPELFEDVAEDSLLLSKQVVDAVGGIADEEKYLLSIHFESAKDNS